jgi:Calx-beta domain-containing protein
MPRAVRISLALFVGLLGVWVSGRADAACHSFTISAKSPVTEGNDVTITVSRDNNLEESSVQVQTANGTAKAPSDYKATIQRVEFTNETSRTIQIPTIEDKIGEETETFTVKLNSARGCRTFNTNYQYGSPAQVKIEDDDEGGVPATTAPAAASPTVAPTTSAAATASASPSGSPTASPTEEPTEAPLATAIALPTPEPDDDGLSPWLVGAAVGALVLAAGGALIATRMRRTRG